MLAVGPLRITPVPGKRRLNATSPALVLKVAQSCRRQLSLCHSADAESANQRMGYVEDNVLPNERVTYRAHLSRMLFVLPLCIAIIGLALCYWSWVAGAVALFVAAVIGLQRYIHYASSEFAVTDRRVIIKVGVLRRRTLEMQLAKIEAVAVNQGIMGRIFGYGDIAVTGTGGTNERFAGIGDPLGFRRAVQLATG